MTERTICRTELELRTALEGCSKLTLSGAKLAAADVEACIKSLSFPSLRHLEELRLEDLTLHPASLDHLASAFQNPGPLPAGRGEDVVADPSLVAGGTAEEEEELELDLFGDDVAEVLEASAAPARMEQGSMSTLPEEGRSGLRTFALVHSPCSPSDAWSPLWRSLPLGLTELELSGNALSDHAIAALSGALRGHTALRLGLRGNRCKDIDRLSDLVSRGCVEALDLSDNLLNDKSIQQLCEILGAPGCRLVELDLSDNRRLSSASLKTLFAKLPRSPVRQLSLRRTSLCDNGVNFLAGMLGDIDLVLLDLALGQKLHPPMFPLIEFG
ncbi:NLRP1 [Symbiodinium natans]|uniref:NLRP1 protein n=1 Tax=Symbiodinium natans TaxID=878477 RepID=A0A812PCQ5_9DINO|nr:NLRP1 [Symbiodinium natans]